jgi:hypothetical protein
MLHLLPAIHCGRLWLDFGLGISLQLSQISQIPMPAGIDEGTLQQVAFLAEKFKERHEFNETEAATEVMLKDELASSSFELANTICA